MKFIHRFSTRCHNWHFSLLRLPLRGPMSNFLTLDDQGICAVIALRLKNERLRRGLSQATVALSSGVSLRTYKRFEASGTGNIQTLVSVLRVLERLRMLEIALPAATLPTSSTLLGKVEALRKRARPGN